MGYAPTPEQQAIIDHDYRRHGRVLAGPGTGKSATVVALVARLCSLPTVPRMRLVTFTRAATAELADKVASSPDAEVERLSTVHSFAIASLLANPGSAAFPEPLRIADDWELDKLIQPDLKDLVGVTKNDVKYKLIPEMAAGWESLEPRPRPDVSDELRSRFLGVFQQHRRVYGYTLLAELPDLLRQALETHSDLKGLEFDFLVVDEYQDLNACDLRVLLLLAGGGTAIFGVGDDEQSIYGFRMAAPEGILRFLEDYPGASDYKLTLSHRCGSDIVRWARHVIESDPDRPAQAARLTTPSGAAAGETAFLSFKSQQAEARGVADLVQRLITEEGLAASDILIMSRGDHHGQFSGPIKEELDGRGISVDDPSWVDQVACEDKNRRVLLLARLLCNRTDSLAWRGLLHLRAGIGSTLIHAIYGRARLGGVTFAEALIASHAEDFPEVSAAVGTRAGTYIDNVVAWLDAHEAPSRVDVATWGDWLRETFEDDVLAHLSDDLEHLLAIADEAVDPSAELDRYMGQIVVLAKDHAAASANGVRFMSMTMSKGLTVEASIIIGSEDGVIPNPRSAEAEERRLLYVAMTRARRFSYATMAARRTGPTARSGAGNVQERRTATPFLRTGPVRVEQGDGYLARRWPRGTGRAGAA
jgi:DNA helicase-2/ATP-dependent DNA helicase PcrA